MKIAKELEPVADSFKTIMKASIAIAAMSSALSSVAITVKDWADLTIPVYEGTKVVGYKTITDTDFETAGENIKKVIIALGGAVIGVYDEAKTNGNEGMFDPQGWRGLGKSKFALVVQSLKAMGPALSSVADSVKDWADLKIPVYRGTKVVGYKTITSQDFETAAGHVKEVVKTLGQAVLETYDNPKAKGSGMFDPQGWHGFGKSKFALVVQTFKAMGPMLGSIANAIKDWVDLKIPKYEGTKLVGYMTLENDSFTKAGDNIKEVLTCIGTALIETVNGHEELFGDDMFTDGPAIVAANAMKIMAETLNLSASAVAAYASGKFPIFDKDGKYVKDLEVDLSKNATFKNASERIKNVLTCIGTVLKETVEGNDIFNDGLFSDSPAVKAAEAIKGMSEALNNSVDAITKISQLNLKDLHTALDPSGPADNVYHRLNDLLTFTANIYKLFVSENSSTATEGTVKHWYGNTREKLSFAEYLNKHNEDVEDANDALGTFTDMISSILDNYSKIGKTITDHQDNLKVFVGGKNSQVYKYLHGSMTSVSAIIESLSSEDKLKLFEKINNKEKDILKGVKSSINICNTLLNGLLTMKKTFNEISKVGAEANNSSLSLVDNEKLSNQINKYASALELIIKVNERAKAAGEDGFNVLRDGILNIYSVTSSIENLTPFKNHADDLSNYVKTINSIDLTRLNSLNNFVSAMNQLSSRLGNLDNLTDAIANRLSMVLHELVDQLMKADQSIKNAHVLQAKRKKLIDEAKD